MQGGRESRKPQCCLIESVDVAAGAREHHSAFESSHDVKGTTQSVRPTDPTREIIDATAKKRLYLRRDFRR
jgi:hypothetical protein